MTAPTNQEFVSGTTITSQWLNGVNDHVNNQEPSAHTSDNISYQPAGTGAVTRTVENKLRESVSVKDFGAVGDGVTDDSSAIRTAISALKNRGGGTLFFPSGTYLVSGGNPLNTLYALTVDFSNFAIVGESLWTTEIRVAPNSNVGPLHLSYATYFSLEDITLNGDYENQTIGGLHGLASLDADHVTCTNIRIKNSVGYGVGFQGTIDTDFEFIKFDGLYLENIGGDGTDFKNKALTNKGLVLNNVYINGVGMTEPGTKKAGLDIRGPATISNVHVYANGNPVIGVRFRGDEIIPGGDDNSGGGNGLGGRNSSLTNFFMQLDNEGTSDGVVIDNESVSISNGTILGVPSGGTGIFCTSNAKYSRISNIGVACTAGTTAFEIGADDLLVANCHAFGAVGAGTGFRFNGNRVSLINCINYNGQYGFRRTAGTIPGSLINCVSTTATSDYATSLSDSPLNCNFLTSSFKSSFISAGGARVAEFTAVTDSVNYPRFDTSITGNPVIIRSTGSDTNVDLRFIPKGTGNVSFGSHATTSDVAITGYITIKDVAGNTRKLAVIS